MKPIKNGSFTLDQNDIIIHEMSHRSAFNANTLPGSAHHIKALKKFIEIALPLDDINIVTMVGGDPGQT